MGCAEPTGADVSSVMVWPNGTLVLVTITYVGSSDDYVRWSSDDSRLT